MNPPNKFLSVLKNYEREINEEDSCSSEQDVWDASGRHLIGIWEASVKHLDLTHLKGILEASRRHLGASGKHLGSILEEFGER